MSGWFRGDHGERGLVLFRPLNPSISLVLSLHSRPGPLSTLGSVIEPVVWTRITRCANLMQQMRTPGGATSHFPNIFDLMAVMVAQDVVSAGLAILEKDQEKHEMYSSEVA